MNDNKSRIRNYLSTHGVEIIGFANVPDTVQLLEIKQNLPRAIVFGYRLSRAVIETIIDRPTLIYKHHYKTVNWILDQTAYHCASYIEQQGRTALAIPASQLVDWEQHKGHVSHRTLAQEAGLGHIGRSGLLIHPVYGARVRYASILTDLEFEPDQRTEADCGTCHKCISMCPAKAISENGVDIKKCYEKLSVFSKIRGIGQHICGVCVRVCDGRS